MHHVTKSDEFKFVDQLFNMCVCAQDVSLAIDKISCNYPMQAPIRKPNGRCTMSCTCMLCMHMCSLASTSKCRCTRPTTLEYLSTSCVLCGHLCCHRFDSSVTLYSNSWPTIQFMNRKLGNILCTYVIIHVHV